MGHNIAPTAGNLHKLRKAYQYTERQSGSIDVSLCFGYGKLFNGKTFTCDSLFERGDFPNRKNVR